MLAVIAGSSGLQRAQVAFGLALLPVGLSQPPTGSARDPLDLSAPFLQGLGFGTFDALHLASAEQGQADVFLTTDDVLLRRAGRCRNELHVRVQNPVSWHREVAL
jgi:hypothetical protein